MVTIVSLRVASSSMNVTQTQIISSAIILSIIFVLRNIASLRLVELNTSFIMIILYDVARLNVWWKRKKVVVGVYRVDCGCLPHSLELRDELVEQKQPSAGARNRASQTCKIMHLPESSGESCLSALIWSRYNKNPLAVIKVEIVRASCS